MDALVVVQQVEGGQYCLRVFNMKLYIDDTDYAFDVQMAYENNSFRYNRSIVTFQLINECDIERFCNVYKNNTLRLVYSESIAFIYESYTLIVDNDTDDESIDFYPCVVLSKPMKK